MTTISAPHSTAHFYRWVITLMALAVALTLAIVLTASALTDSGGASRTGVPTGVRPGDGAHTLCVPHGAAKLC